MTRRLFLTSFSVGLLTAPAWAKAPIQKKTKEGRGGQSVKKRRRRRRRSSRYRTRKAVIGLMTLVGLTIAFALKRRRDRERYAKLGN